MQFRKDWEYYVNRSARWVDFDNDYRTMDLSYMESVMWAFKPLWDKGLVYEGYPRRPLFVGGADAAVATSRRGSTIPTACARTRR